MDEKKEVVSEKSVFYSIEDMLSDYIANHTYILMTAKMTFDDYKRAIRIILDGSLNTFDFIGLENVKESEVGDTGWFAVFVDDDGNNYQLSLRKLLDTTFDEFVKQTKGDDGKNEDTK